jgi:hypothetical protein
VAKAKKLGTGCFGGKSENDNEGINQDVEAVDVLAQKSKKKKPSQCV